MHKTSSSQSGIFTPRALLALVFICASAFLVYVSFAADPPSGTITPGSGNVTWTGTGSQPTGGAEDACEEGVSCDSFELTISGTPADWAAAAKLVHVEINWSLPTSDYDLYVHKGGLDGPVIANSGSAGTMKEAVDLNPTSSSIGTGVFTVHVVYFAATAADQYHGTASTLSTGVPPVPAPQASGTAPRFEIFNPPAAGPNTLGRNSGEPSIGIGLPITGHPEGRALFQADVQTLRVTFNGACDVPRAIWENKPAATSQEDFDPILFTDRTTGRTVVHLLSFAGNVIAGESSVTDTAAPFNDGDVYVPSKGSGIGSGIDHQTVGGGPYAPPLDIVPKVYPHATYYCSQALVDASCARSDDGGINYGPSTVTYSTECGGLHGHVKVAPDGTVYLPNKGCGTEEAVVVSEDNGTTWQIRPIPGSTASSSDPSVGIGSGGRVYFGFANGDTKAAIAVSNDKGKTWGPSLDVGAALGINNVVFPAVVAGDNDRAAFAFLGTPTAGGLQGPRFTGIWHLYVATTYDGGATWTTVDATPDDPVQRGCVWLGGGSNICRNLLDFMDVQIDQQGRVLVGYADGCTGAECVQAAQTSIGNSYTALAAIARQSGGRRLLAAFDPPAAATAPSAPALTGRRDGSTVNLAWSIADDGGSPITAFNILRGTASGAETQIGTVPGDKRRYQDTSVIDPAATYYYKVEAVNAQGTSCGTNEVAVRYVGDSSVEGITIANDPTGDQTGNPVNADLDVQSLSISEPSAGAGAGKVVFKLKVADLTTSPNERMWRVVWNSPLAPDGQFYVGMTKDASGGVSFEYGTVATQVVGLVLGVPTTTKLGDPDEASFTPDGLITIAVSRDKIGNVRIGDLLGAFSVRTYATVTNEIRSTNAIDTTANAQANDSSANAFTYQVVGTEGPSQLLNISTRVNVQPGDNALIAGFIITGTDPKTIVVRGIGPSLMSNGAPFPGRLEDPTIDLYDPSGALIASNDNWSESQAEEIQQSGLQPSNNLEAAIISTLQPGAYTAIVRGKDNSSGIGLVEAYDITEGTVSKLANISTRGVVDSGDNVMIGGFIIGPTKNLSLPVLIRAIGPSLSSQGLIGTLPDPNLTLFDANGAQIASNDDWQSDPGSGVSSTGIAPADPAESAIFATLGPGLYTAVVDGKGGSGIALVEVYGLQ